jgi:hypothetical protein
MHCMTGGADTFPSKCSCVERGKRSNWFILND